MDPLGEPTISVELMGAVPIWLGIQIYVPRTAASKAFSTRWQ